MGAAASQLPGRRLAGQHPTGALQGAHWPAGRAAAPLLGHNGARGAEQTGGRGAGGGILLP